MSDRQSVFQQFRRMKLNLIRIILIGTLLHASLSLPLSSDDDKELKNAQGNSNDEEEGNIGGDLDSLLSDMFNRIIQKRLENLLQGVTTPDKNELELREKSESLNLKNENLDLEEGEGFLDISLPKAVTQIPRDVFTNLPGILWFFSFLFALSISCLI